MIHKVVYTQHYNFKLVIRKKTKVPSQENIREKYKI